MTVDGRVLTQRLARTGLVSARWLVVGAVFTCGKGGRSLAEPPAVGKQPACTAPAVVSRESRLLRATLVGELVLTVDPVSPPFRFVYVPAGGFTMGVSEEDRQRLVRATRNPLAAHNAVPDVQVRVAHGFFMLDREVTVSQYAVIEKSAAPAKGADCNLPLQRVSWVAASEFCNKLSRQFGEIVRLPTEIEWEYAARGGTARRFPWPGVDEFYAWADLKDPRGPREALPESKDVSWCGVRELGGNVSEWCADEYADDLLQRLRGERDCTHTPSANQTSAGPGNSLKTRSIRGGSYKDSRVRCELTTRRFGVEDQGEDSVGFRVVIVVEPPKERKP